jgi:hypothetical protein
MEARRAERVQIEIRKNAEKEQKEFKMRLAGA